MDGNNVTFGEVFFSELETDSYLLRIYNDILYNYSLAVFGFTRRKKRDIPILDALTFADLLSKSNHSVYSETQRMWSQEIVTMLSYLYPEDSRVSFMAGVVLSNLGNYQGQAILNSTFDGVDTLDRLFSGFKREYLTIPADPSKHFMPAQKKVYEHLSDSYFSYSGPTSMGKSYIMRMYIKQRILEGKRENYAIIVPTKALINEVQIKVTEDLGESLQKYSYHIVTAAGDAALKLKDETRHYIYIMTPERLLYLLINEKKTVIDYLFIDEAQKISGGDTRSPFYYQVVQMLSESGHRPKIVFASPNVPNPQVYLNTLQDIDRDTLINHRLASRFSPVTQIKFLINLETHETSVYNEHTKELIPFTSVALEDADLTDVLLRFHMDKDGKRRPFIVYFASVRKTVEAARDYAANLVMTTPNKELEQLSKDIKNDVHSDYYLADLISVGVAYHIGYLPGSIRRRIEQLFRDGEITALFCTSTLVEGVNLPADNLFVTDYRNGRPHMTSIEFRNLIGRVGRLEFNLYGNVFLVASDATAAKKYVERLQEDIPDQTLSIEKELTKPDKRHIIETLLKGTTVIEKSKKSQTNDEYDLMRKFAIMLLNDIMRRRNSRIYREFSVLMKPGEEDEIRQLFAEKSIQPDDDITVSIDQVETLNEAIAYNKLEFPAVDSRGNINKDELLAFLERLCRIFKWEKYESETLGHVSKKTRDHALLRWYAVTLRQWIQGQGLNTIMFQAISNKQRNPRNAMFKDGKYYDYLDTREHKNEVISDVLSVIDKIILFKLSNYFLKVSKAYKEIRQVDKVPNDWYEFVEYGSTNEKTITLQKHGFTRESALYIIKNEDTYVISYTPELRIRKNIFRCSSRGTVNDAKLIRYNIPEVFVD